ncbi:N-formylglutamate amidohydrolase [Pseudonocardia thermophila]|uniref:N-formylglutamate amidohydrolase n=1 Tax=Pseudonocardia thermophila TaxID=1848 RepID=UPI00248DD436|nr:N-formylglutamate amidohydrolase [Pseudonocardia thermophila]
MHTGVVLVPGDPHSPVLLHVPHAGTEIPDWAREHLLLDDAELAAELAALTDHRTDELAAAAADAARVRPHLLVNPISRFVVDVERFPDEREEMAAVGMAAVYTHGTRRQRIRADDPEHHAALRAAFYTPWAEAVRAAVEDRLAATGRAVLIDVHSYPSRSLPYELHANGPRPPVCVGTDAFHTPPHLVAAARAAFGMDVRLDTPFSGVYVPLAHWHRDHRVTALMIEIRRDCYLVEPAGPPTDGFAALAGALAHLVDTLSAGITDFVVGGVPG